MPETRAGNYYEVHPPENPDMNPYPTIEIDSRTMATFGHMYPSAIREYVDRVSCENERAADRKTQSPAYQGWNRARFWKRQWWHYDLDARDEDEQFVREMDAPIAVHEDGLGVDYQVRILNQDKSGTPIVAYLGLSLHSGHPKARMDLNSLSHYVDQPIIAIDPIGLGGSSPAENKHDWDAVDLAKSNVAVLNGLGVDRADLIGYSWGGVVAGRVAVELGAAACNLVTVSAVGFEHGTPLFVRNIPREITINMMKYIWQAENPLQWRLLEMRGTKLAETLAKSKRQALVANARILIPPSLAELATELDETTQWTDITGSSDKVTDYRKHLEVVRERNQRVPGRSKAMLLAGEGHMWVMHGPAVMSAIASSLDTTRADYAYDRRFKRPEDIT